MANLANLSDLKAYLGITTTAEDTLLTDCLVRASGAIESYCGRWFTAHTATRYFGPSAVIGDQLYVDEDLLTVTQLLNGDTAHTAIIASDYRLQPRNVTPKYRIEIIDDAIYWTFADDEEEVTVTGTWGWSATPPADIEQACIRLAAYLYRQKDAQFETAGVAPTGQIIIPPGMPKELPGLLAPYRRLI